MHHYYDRGMGMMGYGGGLNIFLIVLSSILIVVVLFLSYKLMQHNKKTDHDHVPNNALQILKERYAKGEITEEEFEQKRQVIHKNS